MKRDTVKLIARLMVAGSICLLGPMASAQQAAAPFTKSAYTEGSSTKGVVLVSTNWGRKWRCGKFENAQLRSLAFDKSDRPKNGNDAQPDLLLEDTSILPASPRFINHAFIVEPGEYLMSGFSVKAARSVSNVGYLTASRNDLLKDGKSKAGFFTVGPGEIVYIGHFFLDCEQDPMPWRYYPSDKSDFEKYLSDVRKEFGEFDVEKVKFRLFDTSTMGKPFTLP